MAAVGLWWSLLWRLSLVLIALYLFTLPMAQLALVGADTVAAVKYRPSVIWGIIALFFGAGAAAPGFVRDVLWGERLRLSGRQWQQFSRGMGAFFLVLTLGNASLANLASIQTWIELKLFLSYPLLVVAVACLAAWIRRSDVAPRDLA